MEPKRVVGQGFTESLYMVHTAQLYQLAPSVSFPLPAHRTKMAFIYSLISEVHSNAMELKVISEET